MRSAVLRRPPWLWGGDLSAFASAAGWVIEPLPSGDQWRVRLAERATAPGTRRLRVNRLADRANASNPAAYTRLRALPRDVDPSATLSSQDIRQEVDRLTRERPGDVGAWLSSVSLQALSASPDELEAVARGALQQGLLPTLRRAELYLLEHDSVVSFRDTALRGLLFITEHPEAATVQPTQRTDGITFASATELTGDLKLGMQAYLAPLLLSCAPWVWGISVGRPGGVLIFTFGQAIPGRRGESAEPLHLFTPRNSRSSAPPPPESVSGTPSSSAALVGPPARCPPIRGVRPRKLRRARRVRGTSCI